MSEAEKHQMVNQDPRVLEASRTVAQCQQILCKANERAAEIQRQVWEEMFGEKNR